MRRMSAANKAIVAEANERFQRQLTAYRGSAYAQGTYNFGDGYVTRQAEGSIVRRSVYACSLDTMWAAYDDFMRNHPFNEGFYMMPKPKNTNSMFVMSVYPHTRLPGVGKWTMSWDHWNENL